MNSNDYSEACLNSLLNTDFYEELPNDANPEYKAKINDKIDDLLSKELINDFEASNLKQGSRTPHFYGLPKMHKEYITFPPLRPICSGFNSCTAKISEFIDAYLKPLAQNTSSYIKDTSDFVERIESMSPPQLSRQKLSWPPWMSHLFILTLIMKRE